MKTEKNNLGAAAAVPAEAQAEDVSRIRNNIERTRQEMDATLGEIHGRFNPTVLKERATEEIKEVKDAVLEHVHEAKETIKAELKEAKDSLKAEVRAEVAEAKTALREATIGKVEHMVTNAQEKVGHLVSDAQDTVKETGRSLVTTIKENPIPVALTGIGLAWLFYNARATRVSPQGARGANLETRVGEALSLAGGKIGKTLGTAASDVGERASGVAHTIGENVDHAMHRAGELVHDARDVAQTSGEKLGALAGAAGKKVTAAAQTVGTTASDVAMTVAKQGKVAVAKVESTYDVNPLAVGAGVLALGAAVGFALPTTKQEDRMMGAVRDGAMRSAEKMAHGALGKLSDATSTLGSKATHALDSSHATGA